MKEITKEYLESRIKNLIETKDQLAREISQNQERYRVFEGMILDAQFLLDQLSKEEIPIEKSKEKTPLAEK